MMDGMDGWEPRARKQGLPRERNHSLSLQPSVVSKRRVIDMMDTCTHPPRLTLFVISTRRYT